MKIWTFVRLQPKSCFASTASTFPRVDPYFDTEIGRSHSERIAMTQDENTKECKVCLIERDYGDYLRLSSFPFDEATAGTFLSSQPLLAWMPPCFHGSEICKECLRICIKNSIARGSVEILCPILRCDTRMDHNVVATYSSDADCAK